MGTAKYKMRSGSFSIYCDLDGFRDRDYQWIVSDEPALFF